MLIKYPLLDCITPIGRPMNYELQFMHWKDPNTGAEREFRLKEEIFGSCKKIGTTFGISGWKLHVQLSDSEVVYTIMHVQLLLLDRATGSVTTPNLYPCTLHRCDFKCCVQ